MAPQAHKTLASGETATPTTERSVGLGRRVTFQLPEPSRNLAERPSAMSAAPQAGKSAALPTVGSVAPPSDRTVDRVRRGTKDLPSLDLGDRLAAAADDDHEVPHMVLTNRSILTYTVDKHIPAAYRTPIPPPVPYACVLAAGADHVRDQLPVLVEDEDPQIEQHMVLMDRIMEGEIGRGQTSGGV
ncbi:hypothetical protein NKR19_g5322 [Coniochaeta hoffmannii]|uniref:Uncharacterized protein n=1 Tax=Coniochaeta hoffmannii TaxID=91930 RepID=A0AA38RXH0_9PEZI|nr:hypothetical protein NKR19_g5322 [Coniochaeta hoffmannii]